MDLDANRKGEFGEKLVELYLKGRLNTAADSLFPTLEILDVYEPYLDVSFHSNPVDGEGTHDHNIWRANLVFPIVEGGYPKDQPKVIVEVKTGPSSDLDRDQREVMEFLTRNPKYVVLRCDVILEAQGFEMSFAEFKPGTQEIWHPVNALKPS